MVLPFNVALYSGVSVAALFAAAGADAYAVGGNAPEFVADFAGVLNSGTEYYRSGGADTTFSSVFTHSGLVAPATMTDSDGVLKWAPHNFVEGLSDASWSNLVGTKTTGQTDSKGGSTAVLLAGDNSTTVNILLNKSFTMPTGPVRLGIIAKASGVDWLWLRPTSASTVGVYFNLSAGAVGTAVGSTDEGIVSLGDGWYYCWLEDELTGTVNLRVQLAENNNDVAFSTAPTTSEGILISGVRVYRTDIGGMVDNWDQSGSGYTDLVTTTTAARFLPRRNHHIYNGTSWENAGILIEPAAATNLLLNSGTLSTQSVTVTAVAHTLHFTGTGTITLSGASTAGPLVGTGTGENNRVSLTFTPSAGSLTCTVSGTVTNAQLEVGSVPTSYISTSGSTVTRAAETLTVAASLIEDTPSALSAQVSGRQTYVASNFEVDECLTLSVAFGDGFSMRFQNLNTSSSLNFYGGQSQAVAIWESSSPGGINKAFNFAVRHSSAQIQAASGGSAGTAVAESNMSTFVSRPLEFRATPNAVFGPTIYSMARLWYADIGEAGIEEASS